MDQEAVLSIAKEYAAAVRKVMGATLQPPRTVILTSR